MTSHFWACFRCGEYLRGSLLEIDRESSQHVCDVTTPESDNNVKMLSKMVENLQQFSSTSKPSPISPLNKQPVTQSPPPPPPPPMKPLQLKPATNKSSNVKRIAEDLLKRSEKKCHENKENF